MDHPRFANALSTLPDSEAAEAEALSRLETALEGRAPDLAVAFATHHHGPALEQLGVRLAEATGSEVVIGCTAESVIGGSREVEGQAGLSLWAASLPGTDVSFFEVDAAPDAEKEVTFSTLPRVKEPSRASLLLLADPFTFPMDRYLESLNRELPGVPAMGGMASGGVGPGQNLLFTAKGLREGGAIGVVLEGDIELRSVVSQGCRPVGRPWVITSCERNVIRKLGGRPALDVLMETFQGLTQAEQELMRRAPFLGLAIDPRKSAFERGDFLVRGVVKISDRERWVAVADFVRRGQTVQFLVRDADSASEDLRLLMESQGGGALQPESEPHTAGALLFSCNGRGTRMFPRPDHDIGCVRAGLSSEVPVAGFFAAGEIGPVGGRNFLHGFTASVAVFRPRRPA